MKLDCKYAGKCGACKYIKESYEESLKSKLAYVQGLLKDYVKIDEIIGMDDPFNYRNKMHTAFSGAKGKNIISGIFEEGSHKVVATDYCKIEDEENAKLTATIKKLMPGFKMTPYDEDRHTGFLRYTLVRVGKVTGQVMLVLVTGTNIFPGKKNFVKAMLKEHPEITTIIWNINDRDTSM
ncbi:MAG: 23S rRNA (uracil(1939)-C(5))-methyltransferase RlmD, partial [Lachnospiraceae bacterium]|nr:23S rRNA (uracil(1939)-C(5))-methyltransferase RlmD [Lachnospiraceae bacterium]